MKHLALIGDRLRIINNPTEIDLDTWRSFIANHPNGTAFQTPEMWDVFAHTDCVVPSFVCVLGSREKILGISLASVKKSPFGNLLGGYCGFFGGPLIADDIPYEEQERVISALLEFQARVVGKSAYYVEIINLWNTEPFNQAFLDAGYRRNDHFDSIIDLTQREAAIWNKFHKHRRNGIKKAQKLGVRVIERQRGESIKTLFDAVKASATRGKAALPSFSFFEALATYVPRDMVWFLEYQYEGKTLGGSVFLVFNGIVYYFYSGTFDSARGMNGNELGIWYAIQNAKKLGCRIFDLGGLGVRKTWKPTDEKPGYIDFKREFGGQLVNYGRWVRVQRPYAYALARTALSFMTRVAPHLSRLRGGISQIRTLHPTSAPRSEQ